MTGPDRESGASLLSIARELERLAESGDAPVPAAPGAAPPRPATVPARRLRELAAVLRAESAAADALAHAERALRGLQFGIESAAIAVFQIDGEGRVIEANAQACRNLGYSRDELLRLTVFDFDGTFDRAAWLAHRAATRATGSRTFETIHRRKDGTTFPVQVTVNAVRVEGEEVSFSFAIDLSERHAAEAERARLESQLWQAQKMESVGRLAGGVAHDFNNMLSVILGHVELAGRRLTADSPLRAHLESIEKAAMHSRDITRQLLGFSRRQVITPRRIDLNEVIREMVRTLTHLIGEDVEVHFHPAADLWPAHLDPSQVDQILANLVVNARDAMPDGGVLTIETANFHVDEGYRREHPEVTPGEYAALMVSDTGMGMDAETRSHLFEPFFTTKEIGKGTGLGLATVYGILRQNGGLINVYSEPGRGTTFRAYFPRAASDAADAPEPVTQGGEVVTAHVLLVEDDPMVRHLSAEMLASLGHDVRIAETPFAALEACADPALRIDLLVTDAVMPGMNGKELRQRAQILRPELRVLFVSGYTANVVVNQGVLQPGIHFLQKPFSLDDLHRKVQEALAGG